MLEKGYSKIRERVIKFIGTLKKGKYPREQFWMDIFASFIMAGMFKFLLDMVISPKITRLAYVVLFIYWMLIDIRRFHDANKPGWWATLNLIPGTGTIAAQIVAGVLKSKYENNKWCEE